MGVPRSDASVPLPPARFAVRLGEPKARLESRRADRYRAGLHAVGMRARYLLNVSAIFSGHPSGHVPFWCMAGKHNVRNNFYC